MKIPEISCNTCGYTITYKKASENGNECDTYKTKNDLIDLKGLIESGLPKKQLIKCIDNIIKNVTENNGN
jgi:hypothetical protein